MTQYGHIVEADRNVRNTKEVMSVVGSDKSESEA